MPGSIVNIGGEEPRSEALAHVEAEGWQIEPLPPEPHQRLHSAVSRTHAPLLTELREETEALARTLKLADVSAARLSPLLPPWLFAPLEAALLERSIMPLHDNGRGTLLETGTGGIRGDAPQPAPEGAPIFKLFGTDVTPAEAKRGVVLAPLAAVARVRFLQPDYPVRDPADAADRTHHAAAELARILRSHGAGTPCFVWLKLHAALVTMFEAQAQRWGLVVMHRFVSLSGDGCVGGESLIPALVSPPDGTVPRAPLPSRPRNPLLQRFHACFVREAEENPAWR